MKKVSIITNGCEKRKLDAMKLKKYFEANDWKVVKDFKQANLVFFNSCAVSKNQEDSSINVVKKVLSNRRKIIVGGCLSAINKERLEKFFNGDVITPKNMNDIDLFFPEHKVKYDDISDANEFYENMIEN